MQETKQAVRDTFQFDINSAFVILVPSFCGISSVAASSAWVVVMVCGGNVDGFITFNSQL